MATVHLGGSFLSSPHLHDLGCSSQQPPSWQEATVLLPCLDSQCARHCRADPAVCACTCTWLLITPECLPQLLLEKCRSSGYSGHHDWWRRAPGIRVTVAMDLAYWGPRCLITGISTMSCGCFFCILHSILHIFSLRQVAFLEQRLALCILNTTFPVAFFHGAGAFYEAISLEMVSFLLQLP